MEKIKFMFVGIVLSLALILLCSESVDGEFAGTFSIKLAGLFLLATVPVFWKFWKMEKNRYVRWFLDE